jgi:alkylation response protein AidB-like acyl-CoA dehydrogenase
MGNRWHQEVDRQRHPRRLIVVWARDVTDGHVKGFLVEKGTPGYDATRMDGKGFLRAVWQAEITLSGVRVAEENRLPGANSFKDAGHDKGPDGPELRLD